MYLPADQGMSVAACHRFAEDQMVPSCLEHLHSAVNAKNDIIYGMMILLFITVSKKSYGIVDKNILCRIKNIQSYKLVFCVQYFLIFTVSCSSSHSLKSVSRTLFMLHR